ncbi:uncharacterized protein EAE98_009706 [Botrytis deweyae]|uniref:Uncharacterized protein n=1 Tax=Botrytis deweyae TaxID=2478750 RepID=A0ABQ7IAL3_9HELO|nr:uncharacterized protein EAE98_009706 [Botrytis deweyae]KAF7918463.1 hypothetical protein EAE98_009706 [Botrytis deweyae]
MSNLSLQPTKQTSYKAKQASLSARPPPSKPVASYQKSSNSYQGDLQRSPHTSIPTGDHSSKAGQQTYRQPEQISHSDRTSTSSTTHPKSGSPGLNVAKSAHRVRKGLDISDADNYPAQLRRQNEALYQLQESCGMDPGNAGQVQQPAQKQRRRHGKGKSKHNGKDRCFIL